MKFGFLILLLAFLSMSCGDSSSPSSGSGGGAAPSASGENSALPPAEEGESFLLDLPLQFKSASPASPKKGFAKTMKKSNKKTKEKTEAKPDVFAERKAALIRSIQAHEEVSSLRLVELMLRTHLERYNLRVKDKKKKVDFEPVEFRFNEILEGLDAELDPHALKVGYETKLETALGKKLRYNLDKGNLLSPLFEGKLQCYSGTLLHELASRKAKGAKKLRNKNAVVIFEPGHVLPGYFVAAGGQWHLYGIETTQSGRSAVYFGPASELNAPIRIVDADYFLVLDLLDRDLENFAAAEREALERTASRYSIDLTKLESLVQSHREKAKKKGVLIRDGYGVPFAFIAPDMPKGDRDRAEVDESVRGDRKFIAPEVLVSAAAQEATAPTNVELNIGPALFRSHALPTQVVYTGRNLMLKKSKKKKLNYLQLTEHSAGFRSETPGRLSMESLFPEDFARGSQFYRAAGYSKGSPSSCNVSVVVKGNADGTANVLIGWMGPVDRQISDAELSASQFSAVSVDLLLVEEGALVASGSLMFCTSMAADNYCAGGLYVGFNPFGCSINRF